MTQAEHPQRILIVEDEPKIARLVADYLAGSGFEPHHLDHGNSVLPWLEEARQAAEGPALVLLDLMLPGTDGLTLCREIRQRWPALPVIMLTARVEEVDRLLGLELGADDYICKPFSPREVVARVKAVLRRTQLANEPDTLGSDLILDEEGWRALADGHDLSLTAVEYQLLKVMMHAPGRIFSRDQLMDHMYRDHRIVSERTVDSHVKKLRRKIADIWPEREVIRSVYGVGYKYQPEE
ncbi:response regulator [Halomonas sp. KAO]|uniref:response regulator n=1 Tax=unclassified Halomonas TaxID=2609666 RepID=UPI00189E6ACE|nr:MULTISPECIES: response regulator [unclassified Halomonas]MBF7053055.1 response regulator [Halomonas sp. KAO]MDT0500645.1 response regulator [Halomonas sp. PAR7]MDT0513164.1 response regulator [Halomonas sp. LES1]MDT0591425.1 response regulator [Halomonas sp. PAR8]